VPARGSEPRVNPTQWGPEYDIRVHDAQGCVWRGKISDYVFRETESERFWEIECTGYAIGFGDAWDRTFNARNMTVENVIIAALTLANDTWDSYTITAASHTISNAADVIVGNYGSGMIHAGQILAFASKFDQGATWTIYPKDDGNRLFTYRTRPSAPTLYLRMQDFVNRDWGYSRSPLFNEVEVEWGRTGTLATPTYSYSSASDTDSQASYGLRRLSLRMWELRAAADADKVAASVLAAAKRPRMNATLFKTVSLENYPLMARRELRPDARSVPPWRIRAGELASFVDMPYGDANAATTDFNRIAMLAGTEYDEERCELTLTPETFAETVAGTLAKYEALARQTVL
jgi:hypothetical protein